MSLPKILFSFDGRINRKTYWAFYIPVFILCTLTGIGYKDWNALRFLVVLILLWPGIAIQIKRWHDRNKSGYWVFINFIPVIGAIWVTIELGFLPGTKGKNRFDERSVTADKSILSCSECNFSVNSDDFEKNELFCPECGSRLEEIY